MYAAVLIQDGVRLAAPATPQTMLAERSSGAYTTALVAAGGTQIVDWGLHLERLARCVAGSTRLCSGAISRGSGQQRCDCGPKREE